MSQILIVDDDTQVRRIMRIFLTKQGYHVHEAKNGQQALAIVEEHALDLVFLDLVMPEMDGFEVLQNIKQRCPKLGVIILSGLIEEKAWVKMMKAGAMDYISKPFNFAQIYRFH